MADVNVSSSTVPDSFPGEKLATAAVDGIISLGQDVYNNNYARREAERHYKRQKDFAELQYERQKEFWQMQNEFNSPAQQRQRFNQAGMNPASAVGQIATNSGAQGLSSVPGDPVPGNQYAQQGFLRLNGLAETLETLSRIEKLGAETGLTTSQMTTEALKQIFVGLGIDEKRADVLIKNYEAEAKGIELENLPEYFRHRNAMYDLDEQYRSAQIEHESALKALSDAQTDESRANAQKLVAETGLAEIKADTERSIQDLNYELKAKAKSETRLNLQDSRFKQITEGLRVRSLRLANQISASESTIKEIEAIFANIDVSMYTNSDGTANWAKYTTEVFEVLNKIAPLLGLF